MAFPTGWSTYWQMSPVNPTGSLTGFPAFLNLSLLTGLSDIARSDGGDIRVSDTGNIQLACDLMPWYSSGSGGLYINLGVQTTGTSYIRVWAGNASETKPDATGDYGQYATYHTGIRGFYPSGGSGDRTQYQNHLAMTGNVSYSPGFVQGTMATNYNGAMQGIGTGSIPSGPPYVLMVSHNIRAAGDQAVMLIYSSTVSNKWYELNFVSPQIRAGVFDAGVAGYVAAAATTAGKTGVWQNSLALYRTTGNRLIYVSGMLIAESIFPPANPGTMNRVAMGYRQAFGRTSGQVSNAAFLTYVPPHAWADYQHKMLADSGQTGFWNSFQKVDVGSSVLLTGISNSLTYSLGDFYRGYNLVGSSDSSTSSNGSVDNNLDFQGTSNVYTDSNVNINNTLGFQGLSYNYTHTNGSLINSLSFEGFSSTTTYESGNIRLALGLFGISQTTTNDFGALNNNLSFAGNSYTQTTEIGSLINSLSLAGFSNTSTSDSGNLFNNVSFGGTSYSNTVSYADIRNGVSFAGLVATNTSSYGNSRVALDLGGLSNTYTYEVGTINNNLDFAGQSNSRTYISGSIINNLSFGGIASALTSSSLDMRIAYALNALSSSVSATSGDIDVRNAITLAGIVSANTSSSAVLNLLLVLNATVEAITILDRAGFNVERMLEATSNTTTSAIADINREVSLGGNINAITSATANTQLNILLNGLVGSVTQATASLDQQGLVALEGVVNVLSQVTGYINIDLSFSGIIHGHTDSIGDISQSVAHALEGIIASRTISNGVVVCGVDLVGTSQSSSDISGNIRLNVDLGSIVQVLTSLNGTLEGSIVTETGETVRFTVYKVTSHNFSVDIQRSFNESVLLVGR